MGFCITLYGIALTLGCANFEKHLLIPELHGLPTQVELKEVPFYPQGNKHCGPASLAMALRYSGLDVTPQDLSSQVYTPGREGSMPQDIVGATRRHGRIAYPINTMEAIITEVVAGHPVIVLQKLGFPGFFTWHYAVVIGYNLDEQKLILRSGNEFQATMSFVEFQQSWKPWNNWAIITLQPKEIPATYVKEKYLKSVQAIKKETALSN
ncbi:putative Peptidase C39, bacteriocin processing [Nitrospina gracilis 3/211]|uniref:Putative Peptidase C39, bacteriocin processing n=1 Tax=Nitrospina gracilis (strain 3/211) TaxID=1266370 RepID=M1ZAZ2_NITG3|nr:putative Peptidase C39, bacteriocin processing [Nitrospina gracilis 3/211]